MSDSRPGIDRYRSLVDDWEAFLSSARQPLPACAWTNGIRTTPDELSHRLSAEGIRHRPLAWNAEAFRLDGCDHPGATLSYLAGLFHLQEEVSLLPVRALAPAPGERVLDLCAAPGSKTLHAAVALQNRGTVVANDRSGGRLNVLRTALHRLGIVNVTTTTGDAARFPDVAEPFDCVIADVPCSCEGTSRKHPDVLRRSSAAQSTALSRTQINILSRAADLCAPGGRIVYATCTYAPEENECVVDVLLRTRSDLRVRPFSIDGFKTMPGITSWDGRKLHDGVEGAMRVWPHHNDTGGFFVALLEKMR